MRPELLEAWKYRELLLIFVQRDLKIRYKNSVLGFGWSLLNPLIQVLTITLVLQFLAAPSDRTQSYHAYVFCGMLPWLFFSTAVLDATNSLLNYYGLIRKTYFPREIIPLATVASNGVHFLLALAVFLLYMTGNALFWWARTGRLDWPIQTTVFLIPLPMIGLVILVSGIALFLSVWTVHFEDMRFLADSGTKILYWLVPVLYFPEIIRGRVPGPQGELLYTLYMLNPLATFISTFRKLVLPPTNVRGTSMFRTDSMTAQEWGFLALAFLTSTLVLLGGHWFFTTQKWKLAERG